MQSVRRVYSFVFHDDHELDGRYLSAIVLPVAQFSHIQQPLNTISNQIPVDLINQRDIQHITFSGKISPSVAQRILQDYWQNPAKQGLTNVKIFIIKLQEYCAYSSK